MPEIWPALVDYNNDLLAQNPVGHTRESGLQLHDVIAELPDETLEEVRYFALGEVACAVKAYIDRPGGRDEVIAGAAEGILGKRSEYYYTYCVPYERKHIGMFRYELRAEAIVTGMQTAMQPQPEALLPGVEQLADVLELAGSDRELRRDGFKGHIGTTSFDGDKLKHVTSPGRAMRNIRLNAFSAASGLFSVYVGLFLPEDRQNEDCIIKDVLDVSDLDMKNLTVVAMNAARKLHVDEFSANGPEPYITSPERGKLKLDRKRIPEVPERIPEAEPHESQFKTMSDYNAQYRLWSRRALHAQRIGCPALYVRQFIPLVMEMLPDIIMEADKPNQSRKRIGY
jgi:hypothetical protein